ncbi:hypothetical protein SNE40_017416 [Patella caerulea]|uniref:AIG1-type G domain-containing protein n=1 Tax=Patella caerulea TaxID=87958 RepID=A0AAN8PLL7_PATCE
MVLVGKTGTGKSETGNSLLKYKKFKTSSCGNSETSQCEFGTRVVEDRFKLMIVDTPGLYDTRKPTKETANDLIRCIGLTSPGPHVFVFVMTVGRFTKEERDTINNLKHIFGEQVMKFVVCLFTCKDKLIRDELTLDQYLQRCPEALKSIIKECNGRCLAINNYADPVNLEKDVDGVLKVVRETIQSNNGECYTGAMYEAAEKVYNEYLQKKEEEKHKKERELEERERRLERAEKDVREQFRKDILGSSPLLGVAMGLVVASLKHTGIHFHFDRSGQFKVTPYFTL